MWEKLVVCFGENIKVQNVANIVLAWVVVWWWTKCFFFVFFFGASSHFQSKNFSPQYLLCFKACLWMTTTVCSRSIKEKLITGDSWAKQHLWQFKKELATIDYATGWRHSTNNMKCQIWNSVSVIFKNKCLHHHLRRRSWYAAILEKSIQ